MASSGLLALFGAVWAVPLAFWLGGEIDTAKVEPLDWTFRIIASDHFTIRNLVTQTVCGLIGVNRHVKHISGLSKAQSKGADRRHKVWLFARNKNDSL